LLAAGSLDGLIVATVEDAHRGPCLAAFERNVGVLVEKPLATTLEDGRAIVEAAARSNALLMVGHVLRFDARYVLLRDAVASGQIGDPLTAYARRLNGKGAQRRLHGRTSLPMFLGVHDYDIVRWTVGSEVTRVVAQERRGFLASQGYAVEDATTTLLTFANGAMATIELGWVLPDGHPTGFDQRLEVNGTIGRAELVGHYAGLAVQSDERETWPDTALWPTVHGRVGGALERETNHFIDCLRTGQTPLVTGEDGLIAVQIALAAEESARTNLPVTL
jgi:myo-inositol 2-dehydrogenase/D-chiro-inositol 1-dehydrogenase